MTTLPESPTGQTALDLAYGRRHRGQQANLATGQAGHRNTTSRVEAAVAQLIRKGEPFTSNEVHDLLKADGGGKYDRNNVSSRLGILAAQKVIVEYVGRPRVPSNHEEANGRKVGWWVAGVRADMDGAAA